MLLAALLFVAVATAAATAVRAETCDGQSYLHQCGKPSACTNGRLVAGLCSGDVDNVCCLTGDHSGCDALGGKCMPKSGRGACPTGNVKTGECPGSGAIACCLGVDDQGSTTTTTGTTASTTSTTPAPGGGDGSSTTPIPTTSSTTGSGGDVVTPTTSSSVTCGQRPPAGPVPRGNRASPRHQCPSAYVDKYRRLWANAKIKSSKQSATYAIARRIKAYQSIYEEVASAYENPMPYYVIGAVHNMECSMGFHRHLHNGNPLTRRTYWVPKNRPPPKSARDPLGGNAPFTFIESARDALYYGGFDSIRGWNLPNSLNAFELYNGAGYRKYHKDVNSPYLWSFTDQYRSGKYVSDGKWSQSAVSQQVGIAAILKVMENEGWIDLDQGCAKTVAENPMPTIPKGSNVCVRGTRVGYCANSCSDGKLWSSRSGASGCQYLGSMMCCISHTVPSTGGSADRADGADDERFVFVDAEDDDAVLKDPAFASGAAEGAEREENADAATAAPLSTPVIVGIVVGIVALIACCAIVLCVAMYTRRRSDAAADAVMYGGVAAGQSPAEQFGSARGSQRTRSGSNAGHSRRSQRGYRKHSAAGSRNNSRRSEYTPQW